MKGKGSKYKYIDSDWYDADTFTALFFKVLIGKIVKVVKYVVNLWHKEKR